MTLYAELRLRVDLLLRVDGKLRNQWVGIRLRDQFMQLRVNAIFLTAHFPHRQDQRRSCVSGCPRGQGRPGMNVEYLGFESQS